MPFLYPLALTMASYSSTWAPQLGAEAVQKGQEDNVFGTSWVVLPADATTLRHTLYQEATNYSSPAKSSLPFAVINKVLLENSHAHLFTCGTCYMWLPSLNKGRVVQPTICPAKPRIFQTSLLTPALYHPKWSQQNEPRPVTCLLTGTLVLSPCLTSLLALSGITS